MDDRFLPLVTTAAAAAGWGREAEMTVRVTESLRKSKRLWFGVLWLSSLSSALLSSLSDFGVGIREKMEGQ